MLMGTWTLQLRIYDSTAHRQVAFKFSCRFGLPDQAHAFVVGSENPAGENPEQACSQLPNYLARVDNVGPLQCGVLGNAG